jgi:hypothetical protein
MMVTSHMDRNSIPVPMLMTPRVMLGSLGSSER